MSRRFHRCRVALHLLLALCLVIPGIAAPAQAVADELHAAAASRMASAADAGAMSTEMMSMDMSRPVTAADVSMQDMPMEDMPCGAMHMSDATPKSPSELPSKSGDCCAPHSCDLSACLGTGCLPELPRIAASVPPVATVVPWRQPRLPAGVADTPLRPPIA